MITVIALIQTATDITEKTVANNLDAMNTAVSGDVKGAVFNRVTDSSQKGITYARSSIELDAITQFFFSDISSSMSAASSGAFNLAMGLPGPLIAELNPIVCLQNTVIPAPVKGDGVKRMSILRKRPDVSTETFQEQWFNLHSILAARLPHVSGYRQNIVLDGPRDDQGNMMVDGMVELWFPDNESIDAAFSSDIGNTLMMHAKEFIAEISTFIVSPVEIAGLR